MKDSVWVYIKWIREVRSVGRFVVIMTRDVGGKSGKVKVEKAHQTKRPHLNRIRFRMKR